MKIIVLLIATFFATNLSISQNMDKMNWLNEPSSWKVEDGNLKMKVTPESDYWRKTHYGFTVDDGPFYYTTRGGEFEVSVKITGDYKTRFDQMGLMLRIDEEHWIKTGIEYVDGVYNFSTVVTDVYSNWSVIELNGKPESIWIKAVRRIDAVEIFYSLDGITYKMSNVAYLSDNKPVMVGMMAASPDGNGFDALFEEFSIKHLPDLRRKEWLKNNKE
jgi:regulation of enolase protein 1 (concanavalin A-like superfamily)